jgi:hypothetical protein
MTILRRRRAVLLSWWSFVMLIGAGIVASRFTYRTKSGVSAIELRQQQLTETHRINANLERTVAVGSVPTSAPGAARPYPGG